MIDTLYDIFKHWSKRGNVYIISDTHFDDKEQKKMVKNWIAPEEFIKKIKSKVGKNDTFIHLGDVGDPKYMEKLKCYKVLLTGNHDIGASKYKEYFDEVYTGPLFISNKILLSHEPVLYPYTFNIHGHAHGGAHEDYRNGVCCGLNFAADVVDYNVGNLKEIIRHGYLKDIKDIHYVTIKEATKKSRKRTKNNVQKK